MPEFYIEIARKNFPSRILGGHVLLPCLLPPHLLCLCCMHNKTIQISSNPNYKHYTTRMNLFWAILVLLTPEAEPVPLGRPHLVSYIISLIELSQYRTAYLTMWWWLITLTYLRNTLATVPSRWYRRRRAYEYHQDLMYLSMVICIYISFPLSVVLKCQRHFVVIILA